MLRKAHIYTNVITSRGIREKAIIMTYLNKDDKENPRLKTITEHSFASIMYFNWRFTNQQTSHSVCSASP